MPFQASESARLGRPRNHLIKTSDPKPRTLSLSQSSNHNNNGSQETKKLLNKRPKKKKIMFLSMPFKALGCRDSSAPAVIRSAADWEAEKERTKKKTRKQSKTTSSPGVSDVCCAPGVGVASDVVPRATHRTRSGLARRGINTETTLFKSHHSRSDASNDRGLNRIRGQCPGNLPQIVMFQQNLFAGGGLDEYDQYGNWRLDVDNMSYEELLDLGERIGYVCTGLREDEISRSLRKSRHLTLETHPLLVSSDTDWKCSICQEGWNADDKLGKLDCGHYHHLDCIKQWLMQKNACPVCKTAALAEK